MGIKRKLEVLAFSNLVLARIMNIFIYISSLRYSGTRYECPICNGKFRKFLSGGNENQRQNSKCPRCRSLERHRLVWIYLKLKINFLKSKQILLYVAPEYCFRKKFDSLKNIQYISVDLESPLAMKKMDVTNLEFDDSIFDSIICLHVLEHVQDDKKAMREFLRVLKPGGWAILQVPILGEKTYEDDTIKTKELRLKYFGQNDHVREYGIDFNKRLEKSGFIVKVENLQDDISTSQVSRYRLLMEDNIMDKIYFCIKPSS